MLTSLLHSAKYIIESKELFSVCPKEEVDYWKQSLGVWGFKRSVVSANMV